MTVVLRLYVAGGLLLASLAMADQTVSQPTKATANVEKLIQQLGDNSFQVRSAASKTLEVLGPESLPKLREAVKQAADPEVRRRLGELIPNMERAAALAPTRINIAIKDKSIREAVKELSRQTGYKIDVGSIRNDRPISLELKNATYWEALQQICDIGELACYPNHDGFNSVSVRLDQRGEVHPGIHHVQGPFRVSAVGFHYTKSNDFSGGRRRNAFEGPFSRQESLSFNLGVSVEPKLPLLGAGQPTITEALDDQNMSMILPIQTRMTQSHYNYNGYRSFMHNVQATLLPSQAGKKVQVLKGTVPVVVISAQKPKITVDNVLEMKNKEFKAGNVKLVVEEANKNGSQITVRMSISEPPAKGVQDYTWMNSLAQRLEVLDEKGAKYRTYGPSGDTTWNPNNVRGTFIFTSEAQFNGGIAVGGLGLGALFGKAKKAKEEPVKLIYHEWTTMNHAVPFEFRDLPLP